MGRGSDEEKYYRDLHLENNTFDNGVEAGLFGAGAAGEEGDGANRFAAGDEAMVIVVGIKDVRIADWKGAVRDWVIAEEAAGEGMVNGVR